MSTVCIIDFNGRDEQGITTAFWAEWDGTKVTFSGDWENVPDMDALAEPRSIDCYQWVKQHYGQSEEVQD